MRPDAGLEAAQRLGVPPLQSLNRLCRLQEDVARGPCVKAPVEKVGRWAFLLMLPPVQFVQEPSHA
jgi:hypothetical protein